VLWGHCSGAPTRSSWQGCWRNTGEMRTSLPRAAMLDDPPTLEQEIDALSASSSREITDQLHLSSAYVELDLLLVRACELVGTAYRHDVLLEQPVSGRGATRCDPRAPADARRRRRDGRRSEHEGHGGGSGTGSCWRATCSCTSCRRAGITSAGPTARGCRPRARALRREAGAGAA